VSVTGTDAYEGRENLPPQVKAAVELATEAGFAYSCHPGQGEFLRTLVEGRGRAVIGETGTGYGVGLAWLAAGMHPGSQLLSVERDPERAAAAASLFHGDPAIRVITGDWRELREYAPFDVLVLDGGGSGKGEEPPLEPAEWMTPGGTIVIDDFSPSDGWPPRHEGQVDAARLYWLEHPQLHAMQITVAPSLVTVVASYLPGGRRRR